MSWVRGENVVPVVDLGAQPCADYFPAADTPGPDPRWPLELWLCRELHAGPARPGRATAPRGSAGGRVGHEHRARRGVGEGDPAADYPELTGGVVFEFASHHGGSWLDHLYAAGCRLAGDGEKADLVVDVHGIVHEPAVRRDAAAAGGAARPGRPVGDGVPPPPAAVRRQPVRHHPARTLVVPLAAGLAERRRPPRARGRVGEAGRHVRRQPDGDAPAHRRRQAGRLGRRDCWRTRTPRASPTRFSWPACRRLPGTRPARCTTNSPGTRPRAGPCSGTALLRRRRCCWT